MIDQQLPLKPTPAPWHLSGNQVRGPRKDTIAVMAHGGADANLILAAPDLLRALSAVKAFHLMQGIDAFPISDIIDRALEKATNAK